MTAVSPSPQQLTATLRTHRDRTINMIVRQHSQHTLNNAPLPHHTITAHKARNSSEQLIDAHGERPSHRNRAADEQRAVDRGRRAKERVRHQRHQASIQQQTRQRTTAHILDTDRQHRQQQLQRQHNRDAQLPAHLTTSVDEWRRRVREEREAIEAEEGQMVERMKQMKQRIVQLQTEERAEERRQQQDRYRRKKAESAQLVLDEKARGDRGRWAAALTSAPSHYLTEGSRSSLSTDSSDDSESDPDVGGSGKVQRGDNTAGEMTRLWDEFKHKWTPEKRAPAATPSIPAATVSAAEQEKRENGDLHSLTASTDASIRELTVMLNEMIEEFNVTAAAAGEQKPIAAQATEEEKSAQYTGDVMAAASAASVTAATAAVTVTTRKPSPLSSPASSPTRLNTAQRQRSVERGEAQEAEWHLILQELKHDNRQSNEPTAAGRTGGAARGNRGRVGLFVPSILDRRDEKKRESQQHRAAHGEQKGDGSTRRKDPAGADEAAGEDDGADGVLYSALIDFNVNDPHEIDRQRRIETQLAAERTARTDEKIQKWRTEQQEEKQIASSERVRDAVARYERAEETTQELDEGREATALFEQTSEVRGRPTVFDSSVDVRQWLQRLERKIDALANQQSQQPIVADDSSGAQRSIKHRATVTQAAVDIFAPVERLHHRDDRDKQHSVAAAEATPLLDDSVLTTRAVRSDQHRPDNDSKYADDEQPQPPPAARPKPTTAPTSVPPPPQSLILANLSASSDSRRQSSAGGGADDDEGGRGGQWTLQQCFARRMGHVIANSEQRRQARQRQHGRAHAQCTADDEYHLERHSAPPSHAHTASQRAVSSSSQRWRNASFVRSTAGPAVSIGSVSDSHRRMQLGARGVVDAREARARSARVWRQLPEIRGRREEKKRREERRRSVERRQSYDRQRRAHLHHNQHRQQRQQDRDRGEENVRGGVR